MRKLTRVLLTLATLWAGLAANAQNKKFSLKGMYFQWGYNKEFYTRSNIHVMLSDGSDFKILKGRAHDKPDYDAILEKPTEISIPQYNYRLGFYLDKNHRHALELNFDHIKYVLTDGQKVKVVGFINKVPVYGDSILDPDKFMHLEHTDGGNLLHLNYVSQKTLLRSSARTRDLLTLVYKFGAGINIPRTDFTYHGDRYNNDFHVAGYNFGTEAGIRFFPLRHLFIEATGKTGYVRVVNALANTTSMKGDRVRHGYGYFECIATLGYDINF
jgi:hypothetical protein